MFDFVTTDSQSSNRNRIGVLVVAFLVTLGSNLVISRPAAAQQRSILWLVETGDGATVDAEVARELFRELLQGADDADHIVDVSGLAEYIQQHGLPIPGCIAGLEPCPDPVAALASELRLDIVANILVLGDGSRISLTLEGIGGGPSRTLEFSGSSFRHTAFQVVTEFVGASASLAVTSRPSNASVVLDGETVGQTPYQAQLAVGIYELSIQLDGYEAYEQTIELRPNETRLIDRDLARLYSDFTVESSTPGAILTIDGEPTDSVNRSFHLAPGPHDIRLEAPGYIAETRQVTLDAGTDRRFRFDLRESPEAIRAREIGYIYERPFYIRGGFRFAGTLSGFSEGEGTIQDVDYVVECPRSSSGDCSQTGVAVNLAGLEGEIGLSFEILEIALMQVSYSAAQVGGTSGDGRTLTLQPVDAALDELAGRVTSVTRLQLEPLRVGGRYLFDPNWAVFGHFGVGWYHESFDVKDLFDSRGDFDRNGWIWSADLGVRYHLNDTVFVSGAFFIGDDFTYEDVELTKGFNISVGVTWEDVIGITNWFGGDDDLGDDDAAPPTELDFGGWR